MLLRVRTFRVHKPRLVSAPVRKRLGPQLLKTNVTHNGRT